MTVEDPEYQRYRRKYPRFPGVKTCVDLFGRANVRGSYLDAVASDLGKHAAECVDELIAAFVAERELRVRSLLLAALAEACSSKAHALFVACLLGTDEDLWHWAARGLHQIDDAEARRALWEARNLERDTPTKTTRFRTMLREVAEWK